MWLLEEGEQFDGRYRIRREIGSGGMGHVYAAFDEELRETVAIKIIRPDLVDDDELVERFKREVRIARQIHHPNVVRIFEFGRTKLRDKNLYYLTMELLAGKDLAAWMRGRPFSLSETIRIGVQICDALGEAHRVGVVHRDLKPANVFIDEHDRAKLMDFGISRLTTLSGLTRGSSFIGTPKYMSPEQVSGRAIDARSDLYSLGVVLFELATRKVPFEGQTPVEVALRHLQERPPTPRAWNRAIPAPLEQVILTCLEKEPAARYPSAAALREALQSAALDSEEETHSVPRSSAVPPEARAGSIPEVDDSTTGASTPWVHLSREEKLLPEDVPTTRRRKAREIPSRRRAVVMALGVLAILVVFGYGRLQHRPLDSPTPQTSSAPSKVPTSAEGPVEIDPQEEQEQARPLPESESGGSDASTPHDPPLRKAATSTATPAPPPAQQSVPPARVRIAANPGTQIFIDDRLAGTVPPVVRRELEPGRHRIRYVIPGYDEHEEVVDIAPGEEHRFAHHFRAFGLLRVVSRPYARVILDDEDLGFTPLNLEKVGAGPHRLILRRDGFRTVEEWVTVRPGQNNRFQFLLTPLLEKERRR